MQVVMEMKEYKKYESIINVKKPNIESRTIQDIYGVETKTIVKINQKDLINYLKLMEVIPEETKELYYE